MRSLKKFVLGSVVLVSVVLVGANLVQTTGMGPQSEVQAAAAQVNFMAHRVASMLPDNFDSFSKSTGAFVRSNATTARLQFEGMKNTLPSSFALSQWMPGSASNLIQSSAQKAGSNVGTAAKKIPVVNGAMHSANEHIASLRQSLNAPSLGF
jgi:hypothetical protein